MKTVKFTKVVASGNDFLVIENSPQSILRLRSGQAVHRPQGLAKKICDRKYGVGADGLLVLEKSRVADVRMRIFNADGSEAEMCGNGARVAALYYSYQLPVTSCQKGLRIETKAGIIEACVLGNSVKIKLTEPKGYRQGIPIKINARKLSVDYINTGVPHAVIFVDGIEDINILDIGREVRYHRSFAAAGTNVDFVEVISKNTIKVRTYERGVEDETLACGTGSVASAIVFAIRSEAIGKINVHTKGKEVLKVYFDRIGDKFTPLKATGQSLGSKKPLTGFTNVYLEGKATIISKGEYNV